MLETWGDAIAILINRDRGDAVAIIPTCPYTPGSYQGLRRLNICVTLGGYKPASPLEGGNKPASPREGGYKQASPIERGVDN